MTLIIVFEVGVMMSNGPDHHSAEVHWWQLSQFEAVCLSGYKLKLDACFQRLIKQHFHSESCC